MRLPNAQSTIVPEQKLTHYLLNHAHPVGAGKAKFFLSFGYRPTEWHILAEALHRHACENDIVTAEKTIYGTRYVVDGIITAPDGSRLNIRSAWYIEPNGDGKPRFVTAHPLSKL